MTQPAWAGIVAVATPEPRRTSSSLVARTDAHLAAACRRLRQFALPHEDPNRHATIILTKRLLGRAERGKGLMAASSISRATLTRRVATSEKIEPVGVNEFLNAIPLQRIRVARHFLFIGREPGS
jgi:hypothetical protein